MNASPDVCYPFVQEVHHCPPALTPETLLQTFGAPPSPPAAHEPAVTRLSSTAFPSPNAEEGSCDVSGLLGSPPGMPVGEGDAFGWQQQLRFPASSPAAWGAAAGAAGPAGSSPQAAAAEEQLSWTDALGKGGDDSLEEQPPSDHDEALPCWTGASSPLRPAGNGAEPFYGHAQGEDAAGSVALICASPPHHACSLQEVQEAGGSPALQWEENAATSLDMGGSSPAFPWEESTTSMSGGACNLATGTGRCPSPSYWPQPGIPSPSQPDCPSPSQPGCSSPTQLGYGLHCSPSWAAGVDHDVDAVSAYVEPSPMRASGATSPAASFAASLDSSPAAFPGASLVASSASSPGAYRAASSHCASLPGSPLASLVIPIGYSNQPPEGEAEAGPDAVAFLHSLAPGTPTDGGVRAASATPPNSPAAEGDEQGVPPSPRQTGRCEQLLPLLQGLGGFTPPALPTLHGQLLQDLGGFTPPPALMSLPGSFQAATSSSSDGVLTFTTPAGDFVELTPSSGVFLTADPAGTCGDSSGGGGRATSSVMAAEEGVPFLTAHSGSGRGGTTPSSSAMVVPAAEEAMPFLTACGSDTACLSTGMAAAAAAGLEAAHATPPPVFGGFRTAGQLHSVGGARSSAAATETGVTLRLFSSPSGFGVEVEASAPQGDGISDPVMSKATALAEGTSSPGCSHLPVDIDQPQQWHACDTSPPSSSPTPINSLVSSPLKKSPAHSSSSCGGWQTPGEAASCGEFDDPTAPCDMHLPSPLPHGGFGGTAGTWESPTPCSSPSTCR